MTLHLQIVTPARRVVEAEVSEVYLPGAAGEIGILPEHAPLVSTLTAGVVRFKEKTEDRRIAVRAGFLQVSSNRVVILADEALLPGETNSADLQKKRTEVEAKMLSADVSPEEREKIAAERNWLAACLSL
ncbi:MAG: ATP synthase F1 subunit epsilon [Pseudomonadota bacterium]